MKLFSYFTLTVLQDIVHLWDGCIMDRDDALQLLLIVDYVFDWARDVYRPLILRQLKSLTTDKPYDQVSMVSDSDIFSLREKIASWIQPPPSTIDQLNTDEDSTIPSTELGALRSALSVDLRPATPYPSVITSIHRHPREWKGSPKYNEADYIIAKGDFAVVYIITNKIDGIPYAAKELKKGLFDQGVNSEMNITKNIKHVG